MSSLRISHTRWANFLLIDKTSGRIIRILTLYLIKSLKAHGQDSEIEVWVSIWTDDFCLTAPPPHIYLSAYSYEVKFSVILAC